MRRVRRSPEEKLAILKEAETDGLVATARKYGIYPSTIRDWIRRYEKEGFEGLIPKTRRAKDPEIEKLKRENELLKKLLAEKELELKVKDALLKKILQRKEK